jgi:hypothetical protein
MIAGDEVSKHPAVDRYDFDSLSRWDGKSELCSWKMAKTDALHITKHSQKPRKRTRKSAITFQAIGDKLAYKPVTLFTSRENRPCLSECLVYVSNI